MRPSNNLENKALSEMYWRVQLVCMNVHGHISLELPQAYNQDQTPSSKFVITFLTILGVMEILRSFGLILEGKAGKGIPESSR